MTKYQTAQQLLRRFKDLETHVEGFKELRHQFEMTNDSLNPVLESLEVCARLEKKRDDLELSVALSPVLFIIVLTVTGAAFFLKWSHSTVIGVSSIVLFVVMVALVGQWVSAERKIRRLRPASSTESLLAFLEAVEQVGNLVMTAGSAEEQVCDAVHRFLEAKYLSIQLSRSTKQDLVLAGPNGQSVHVHLPDTHPPPLVRQTAQEIEGYVKAVSVLGVIEPDTLVKISEEVKKNPE